LEALAALVDSEKINENRVDAHWKIIIKTPSKGNVTNRKRLQPLLTQKKSMKQIPKVMRGFVSAHSHVYSEKISRVTGDAWICESTQPF